MEEQFSVKHNDGGFVDISNKVYDYGRDEVLLQLKTTSTLYIGYRKPFNFMYASFIALNDVPNALTVQYHDVTDDALKSVLNLSEETEGFTREGFIKFTRPELNSQATTAWKPTTVDGEEMFWLVITTDTDHNVLTKVNALGILFNNEQDIIQERSNITSKHAQDERTKTWVVKAQASRDEIVQAIRTQGKKKVTSGGILEPSRMLDITAFDFLRLDQIRQASKWLSLAKIFQNELSDAADDKWMTLGETFEGKFDDAFDVFLLSLDTDDDGEEDFEENIEDAKRISLSYS